MCIDPVLIKNPYKGQLHKNPFYRFKDCTSTMIKVPCGHCPECVSNKQMSLVQRIQMECLNNHLFMITLTYSDEMIPYLLVNDRKIKYADVHDVQNMFKRIRKYDGLGRPFKYFGVSERGKKGRPHFHILLFVPKYEDDNFMTLMSLEADYFRYILDSWSRNVGTNRKPIYKRCCTYVEKWENGKLRKNFDLHYVNPALSVNGEADVGFYTLKYLLKPSESENRLQQALKLNCDEQTYNDTWRAVKSRSFHSLGFGLSTEYGVKFSEAKPSQEVLDHVKKGVQLGVGNSEFPLFINPVNGSTFPLSRYYKSRADCFSLSDAENYYLASKSQDLDSNTLTRESKTYEQIENRLYKQKKIVELINLHSD